MNEFPDPVRQAVDRPRDRAPRRRRGLLWVDRHYVHEGSFHAFSQIKARGATASRPDLTFGVADHYVPTRGPRQSHRQSRDRAHGAQLEQNTAQQHGITLFGLDDPRQGIVHVVGPEQGLTLPGLLIVCGDSHTSTHGALGAYAFGIGASEVAHVLMTQTLWQSKPKRMRITVDGNCRRGVGAKDIALAIIARIGADGAHGHAIEYAGSAIRALSMEGRLTLCNMSIEAGARCGMVAPDETTFAYLEGRPYAPEGRGVRPRRRGWSALASDATPPFDREVALDAAHRADRHLGHQPEDALPIDASVPDPAREPDPARAKYLREALDYMGLAPGQKLTDIRVDRVFIGSCTNSAHRGSARRRRGARRPQAEGAGPGLAGLVAGQAQAEEEGLDRIFREAGLEWASPAAPCASASTATWCAGRALRLDHQPQFPRPAGPGARTHLMSPAMVAAAAVDRPSRRRAAAACRRA